MAEKTIEQLQAELAELKQQLASVKAENVELCEKLEVSKAGGAREQAIQKKIAESGGALNREQAILALTNQAEHDAAQKKGARK